MNPWTNATKGIPTLNWTGSSGGFPGGHFVIALYKSIMLLSQYFLTKVTDHVK